MSLNKVMLIGNVGKDPEVRYLEGAGQNGAGRKVATFTLATSERYRDRNGDSRENTEWHNIVAWGQPADIVERFVKKGTQLYIEGRLRTRSWTDKTGGTRYTTEINVDNLQLLGRKDGQNDGGYQQGGQYYGQQGGGNYQQGGSYAGQQGSGNYQPSGTYAGQQGGYQQPSYQKPYQAPAPAEPAKPAADDDPADDLPF